MKFELGTKYSVKRDHHLTGTFAKITSIVEVGETSGQKEYMVTVVWYKYLDQEHPKVELKKIKDSDGCICLDECYFNYYNKFEVAQFEPGESYFTEGMEEAIKVSAKYESELRKGEFYIVDNDSKVYKVNVVEGNEYVVLNPQELFDKCESKNGIKLFASEKCKPVKWY